MKLRVFRLVLLCVVGLTAYAFAAKKDKSPNAAVNDYQVEAVDLSKSTLTIKNALQEETVTVTLDADITIDGSPASLKDLHAPMSVKVSFAEPGVVQHVEAVSSAAMPNGPAAPSIDFSQDQKSLYNQAEQVVKAKITPATPDEFILKNIRKGLKIGIRYSDGSWRGFGRIHPANPDDLNCPDRLRLAIALPGSGSTPGDVVAVVPALTSKQEFIFFAKQDYPALVLRINDTKYAGTDAVYYYLRVAPDQGGL
jgi:hypothetical protein